MKDEIKCFGCGLTFSQEEQLPFPFKYGELRGNIKCANCGWKGIIVIDVKRLEPNIIQILSKIKEDEQSKKNL